MLSIDTNILFHAFNEDSPSHAAAFAWLTSNQNEEDVAVVRDYEGMGFRRVWNPLATS